MERIVILGPPGAGKSTFARSLADRVGLQASHLDALFYGPGWTSGDTTTFRARVADALAGERWISDGNFIAATADLRFPAADTIIVIEQPRWRRIVRAIARAVWSDTTRADLPAGCRDSFDLALLRDIWSYERRDMPAIEAALQRHASHAQVIRLDGDAAMAAFLRALANVAT